MYRSWTCAGGTTVTQIGNCSWTIGAQEVGCPKALKKVAPIKTSGPNKVAVSILIKIRRDADDGFGTITDNRYFFAGWTCCIHGRTIFRTFFRMGIRVGFPKNPGGVSGFPDFSVFSPFGSAHLMRMMVSALDTASDVKILCKK